MSLPTESEINVHGSLDEVAATDHFLGKSVAEAERLFRDDSARYQEDLMWMGPRAFAFYLQAVIAYLESPHSAGDDHLVSALYDTLVFRSETDPDGFALGTDVVRALVTYVVDHFTKFEVDTSVYGDLLQRYQRLREGLVPPSGHGPGLPA